MRRSTLLGILAALAVAAAPAAPDDPHTTLKLVADVAGVRPGGSFAVGVVLTMEPGWHTYWKNPGDAGLPTEIVWKVPPGITVGPLEWPLPQKFLDAGDVLSYGYAGEATLLATVTASPDLAPGSRITITAEGSWLECEKVCVPGSGTAAVTLPVLSSAPAPANAGLFRAARARIPPPYDPSVGFTVTPKLAGGVVELDLAATTGTFAAGTDAPDFYPEQLAELALGRTEVRKSAKEAALRIPLTAHRKVEGPLTLRGVVVYALEGGERAGAAVELHLPPEFCATIPLPGATKGAEGLLDRDFDVQDGAGAGRPLGLYLLFAVIGGLLLNVMPCVLPVIALKVFGLVKMAGDQPRRIRRHGWTFSLGILASFLLLAALVIALQLAGQQVGWGFQFQEPLFVIAMCAVVFAFGLSLFGVYEIRLPAAAVAGVSGIVTRQEAKGGGYAASFWEGVFATILATPCTAPFLGSALGFAFSQPWWVILVIFACVALGMALPYLLLTARPAWVRYLPKPGEWMVTAKQFMGFLMMATLLWLLYILGRQLGMEGVIWTSAFLLALGVACWLIGRFATLSVSRGRALAVWGAAVVVVAAGYLLFLESVLDVRALVAGTPAAGQAEEIAWEPFSVASLEQHLAGNRTVLVDFTAEWCLTCKVNERTVLADREVVARIRSSGIVPVKADWTNRSPEITQLLRKFGRSGVPLYVLFPAGRPERPILLPEVITPSIVLEAIDRALAPPVAG